MIDMMHGMVDAMRVKTRAVRTMMGSRCVFRCRLRGNALLRAAPLAANASAIATTKAFRTQLRTPLV